MTDTMLKGWSVLRLNVLAIVFFAEALAFIITLRYGGPEWSHLLPMFLGSMLALAGLLATDPSPASIPRSMMLKIIYALRGQDTVPDYGAEPASPPRFRWNVILIALGVFAIVAQQIYMVSPEPPQGFGAALHAIQLSSLVDLVTLALSGFLTLATSIATPSSPPMADEDSVVALIRAERAGDFRDRLAISTGETNTR